MSIAIYAIIKPSRILHALTGSICLLAVGVAVAIGFGMVGDLPLFSRSLLGACCFFTAFSVFYQRMRRQSAFHIHISGSGQIRIAKLKWARFGMREGSPVNMETKARLMPGTTIWPRLLLLRLQLDDQSIIAIPILPDSVPDDTFRALSIACRWLAARTHSMKY